MIARSAWQVRARVAGRAPAVLLASLLVAALVGWVSLHYLQDRLFGGTSCAQPVPLSIAAAPSIASAVRAVSRKPSTRTCYRAQVRAVPSATMLNDMRTGLAAPATQVWIPESTWWLRQAQIRGIPNAPAKGTSIASSPVVAAVTENAAASLNWPFAPLTWTKLLGPDATRVAIGAVDPAVDPVSMMGLLQIAAIAAKTGRPGTTDVALLTRLATHVVPDPTALRRRLPGGGPDASLDGLLGSEQEVLQHNAERPAHALVAVYPDGAVPALDYPFVVLPGADRAQLRAAQQFLASLLTPKAVAELSAYRLRPPDGRPVAAPADGRTSRASLPPVPLPAEPVIDRALELWSEVNLGTRLLAVVDVSGSMNQRVGSGGTRLDATVQAAGQLFGRLRETTDFGLWTFSTRLDGDRAYREALPVGPLYRQEAQTRAALSALRAQPDGGAGLYDTVLAAYQNGRQGWMPGRINLVVLVTASRNDDSAGGIALDKLLAELAGLNDPQRPLQIITVGIGPDVDAAALAKIAAATGGRSYRTDGNDLGRMLLDVMSQQFESVRRGHR
jgi:hypothetical protein